MKINCDNCGAVAETVKPESVRDGDIEHTFFRCPECGAVYPISATDTALRADITEYSRRRQDGGAETGKPETMQGADGATSIGSFSAV